MADSRDPKFTSFVNDDKEPNFATTVTESDSKDVDTTSDALLRSFISRAVLDRRYIKQELTKRGDSRDVTRVESVVQPLFNHIALRPTFFELKT